MLIFFALVVTPMWNNFLWKKIEKFRNRIQANLKSTKTNNVMCTYYCLINNTIALCYSLTMEICVDFVAFTDWQAPIYLDSFHLVS